MESVSPLEWKVRLADQAPEKLAGLMVAALGAGAIGAVIFRSPLFALLGFAIILGSTAEFWLGSRFRIDGQGVSARTGLSFSVIEWGSVKRVLREPGGLRISPLTNAGTMDAFRGVYLRYGVDNRARIEEAVERFGGFRADLDGRFIRIGDAGDGRKDCDGDLPPATSNSRDPAA